MPSPQRRLFELDGLRGCAVTMVLVMHLGLQRDWGSLRVTYWFAKFFGAYGQGVDIFFVLSGFLIGGILLDQRSAPHLFRTFYARRFFRIIPLYWVLLASQQLLLPLDSHFRFGLINDLNDPNPLPFWRYFLFIQNNVAATTGSFDPTWLTVTWSLAIEEQFYLVAPWLVRFLRRWMVAALCVLALVGCPVLRYYYVAHAGNQFAASFLLVCRADALCAGLLVAVLMRSPAGLRWTKQWVTGIGIAALGLVAWSVLEPFLRPGISTGAIIGRPSLYAFEAALVILYLLAQPTSVAAGILRRPPFVFAGRVSYFVYLFHLPCYCVLAVCFPGRTLVQVVFTVILTFLAGYVSQRWFEEPLIAVGRRYSYGAA
jgi:peptidoglycan/LPS O-acetylase OafA/YrhL